MTPDPGPRYNNRDLSWLEFNRRVLAQVLDPRTPLLERVRFLAIFTSNLDEFFMKRVGWLRSQARAGVVGRSPDGRTPPETLASVRVVVVDMFDQLSRCFEKDILPALAERSIRILTWNDLDPAERKDVEAWFRRNVFPVITPLAVDPGHRFPFISNLSENLGVLLSPPGESERLFARVKIPDVLPRMVRLPVDAPAVGDDVRLLPLEEILRNNLDDLFPGMQVHEVLSFRVTRSASVSPSSDPDDLLQSVEQELKMRRFAGAVRLEVTQPPSPTMLDTLSRALSLVPDDIYLRGGLLDYNDLYAVADLPRPELKFPLWRPVVQRRLADEDADIFAAIRERDILLHHPYDSFSASVERFIAAAARDPDVLAIKQTLYRTSRDSPFVTSLVHAAEQGKHVACLVELRARFDESKNVRFARMLESSGVHVAYGVVGLKTHCKCSLVVRREGSALRCYAHLGTGNYHPGTAHLYTDLGLLTADPDITEDVVSLFNFLTGRSLQRDYRRLLVAPYTMRSTYSDHIDREIAIAREGGRGRILAKMNAMEDRKMADKLYEASAAGVEVTLVVRGFCCLRAGVPGLSDNIRVISVVGRFLEHSRVFHFGQGAADPLDGAWYISSADWMYRNLNDRVETAVPILDRGARARLRRLFDVLLDDHRCAWDLLPDSTYRQRTPQPGREPDSAHNAGTFAALMWETQNAKA